MTALGEDEGPGRVVSDILRTLQDLGGQKADPPQAGNDDELVMMGHMLAIGPNDPDLRRRVFERNPRTVALTAIICAAERELRTFLTHLTETHHLTPAMLMMLFGQILASMERDDPPGLQGWRRYLLATFRPIGRINRRLVRELGYGILARERALHAGATLTDGIGPPVSASERRSI